MKRQVYPECVVLINQHGGPPSVFLDVAAARTYITRAGNTPCADTFEEFANKAGYDAYYCNMYG